MVERNFLVLDFEATCSNSESELKVPRNEMEIIEVGAVIVNPELQVIGEFNSFVKPQRRPHLTAFATELTSITQTDVDGAPAFPQVANKLALWAASHGVAWWGSWGAYDRGQLTQDVRYHRVPDPLPQPHRNLKLEFSAQQGLSRRLGLSGALKLAGLSFEGTAHRAIDDTRNIARLLPFILGGAVLPNTAFSPSDVEEGRVSNRSSKRRGSGGKIRLSN